MSPGTSKQGTLFEVTFDASTGQSNADISIIPSGCPDVTTENCIPVKGGSCYGVDACPTSVWAAIRHTKRRRDFYSAAKTEVASMTASILESR